MVRDKSGVNSEKEGGGGQEEVMSGEVKKEKTGKNATLVLKNTQRTPVSNSEQTRSIQGRSH